MQLSLHCFLLNIELNCILNFKSTKLNLLVSLHQEVFIEFNFICYLFLSLSLFLFLSLPLSFSLSFSLSLSFFLSLSLLPSLPLSHFLSLFSLFLSLSLFHSVQKFPSYGKSIDVFILVCITIIFKDKIQQAFFIKISDLNNTHKMQINKRIVMKI